ncbi:MAG: bifunctional pyr operon transcriptional regulator/uracil phosphoribosyltransferase PyrR [Acidobacteriota bacterium]|nr:MAG: bifunctional pyr operon transcriptional regulator/uracil phosphoribosyltransferase PyrR [Acidobacteriota bacterium]
MGIKYLRRLMKPREMDLALSRIAAEIIEDHADLGDVVLIGIRRRGIPLAERLRTKIQSISGHELPLGILDITFYRDDLSLVGTQPVVEGSHLDFQVDNKTVLLVDDVLNTGRTTRAALESVIDYGRPKRVELVVLVDRGHRELPIQADYVGKYVETAENEVVEVRVPSVDGEEGVFLTTPELLKEGGSAARKADVN